MDILSIGVLLFELQLLVVREYIFRYQLIDLKKIQSEIRECLKKSKLKPNQKIC